jgi:hypothetical protein
MPITLEELAQMIARRDGISYEEYEKLQKEFDEVLQEFPEGAVGFRDSDRS